MPQLLLMSLVHSAEKCFSGFSHFLPTNAFDPAQYTGDLCIPVPGTVHEANIDGICICIVVLAVCVFQLITNACVHVCVCACVCTCVCA